MLLEGLPYQQYKTEMGRMGTPVGLNQVPVARDYRARNLSLYVRVGEKHSLCPGKPEEDVLHPRSGHLGRQLLLSQHAVVCPLHLLGGTLAPGLAYPSPSLLTLARATFLNCISDIITPPFEILHPLPPTWSWDKSQMLNMAYGVPLELFSSPPSTSLLNFVFLQSPFMNYTPAIKACFLFLKGKKSCLALTCSAWNAHFLLAMGSFANCTHFPQPPAAL